MSWLSDAINKAGSYVTANRNELEDAAIGLGVGGLTGGVLGNAGTLSSLGLGEAGGAAGLGLLGGAAGASIGSAADQARIAKQNALNKQAQAQTNLGNFTGTTPTPPSTALPTTPAPTPTPTPITPAPTTPAPGLSGTPTTGSTTNPVTSSSGNPNSYVMNPSTGLPVFQGDPNYQSLVNSGQIPFGQNGQPLTGGNMNPPVTPNPAIVGNAQTSQGNVPVDNGSTDITYNLGQTDPALQAREQQILGTNIAQTPGSLAAQAETNAGQLENANDLAAQLSTQTLNTQNANNAADLTSLQNLLTDQAQTQYQRELPGLEETLNSQGLLTSSDLGNQMGIYQQQSYQDVANQLAQQQLAYNNQYNQGLGNITNQYNAGVGSALQREFSVQDYANQLQGSLQLGQAVTPVQPYNSKTQSTQGITAATGLASAAGNLSSKG